MPPTSPPHTTTLTLTTPSHPHHPTQALTSAPPLPPPSSPPPPSPSHITPSHPLATTLTATLTHHISSITHITPSPQPGFFSSSLHLLLRHPHPRPPLPLQSVQFTTLHALLALLPLLVSVLLVALGGFVLKATASPTQHHKHSHNHSYYHSITITITLTWLPSSCMASSRSSSSCHCVYDADRDHLSCHTDNTTHTTTQYHPPCTHAPMHHLTSYLPPLSFPRLPRLSGRS